MDWFKVLQWLVSIAEKVGVQARDQLGCTTVVGQTADGDIETSADELAYNTIKSLLSENSPWGVSLFSETTGSFESLASQVELQLIVDELDGSRPHAAGMTCCSVCLACLPAGEEPLLKNVKCGVVYRLDGGWYGFAQGYGAYRNGTPWRPSLADVPLGQARIFFETVNSACLPLLGLWLAPFESCTRQGLLSIASSAWAATSIASGAAQVHLHLGRRICDQWEPVLGDYIQTHHGHRQLGQHCYDVAAVWGLLQQVEGCVITDGYGKPLDDLQIDDVSDGNTFSQIIAPRQLHRSILDMLQQRETWLLEHQGLVRQLITGQP